MEAEEEYWKFIRGTLRRYSVSNHGRIRSNAYRIRRANGSVRWYEVGYLEPKPRTDDRKGLWCKLKVHGRARQINVGICVAEHWLYKPIRGGTVVWLDGNHENCHVSNLAWRPNESFGSMRKK